MLFKQNWTSLWKFPYDQWLNQQSVFKCYPACKKQWWGTGVVVCLEWGADLHMAQLMPLPLTVSCSSKIQIGLTFLVPAYPGSPGKEAVKWLLLFLSPYVYLWFHAVSGWQLFIVSPNNCYHMISYWIWYSTTINVEVVLSPFLWCWFFVRIFIMYISNCQKQRILY